MTRRTFLARAAVLGVSVSTIGGVLAACEQAAVASASPRSPGTTPGPLGGPPVIVPAPVTATYGAMLGIRSIVPVEVRSEALRALLEEVAADARVPIDSARSDGAAQALLTLAADDGSLTPQAYRLDITPAADGASVTIRAADAAGAYYGLLSLGQLVVADGSRLLLRAATVDDAPGFARRGAILDPYVLPNVGVTVASQALLLERVRLGARCKLNFVDLLGRTPWPELVNFCDEHHIELMNAIGYRDALTVAPRAGLKRQLGEMFDAGTRSFAFAWDDIRTTNPEELAHLHAGIFTDLYGYVRGRDPAARVSAVLPPYGGIPGKYLVGSTKGEGERYLAVMRDELPDDVRIFWTGDGGIFSETVTTAGAQAYADAVGHELGLWDNDTIGFSRTRQPCSGRAPDLASVVHTYMGNLAGEANWEGTNGEFAMLTSLLYAWNPAAYDPAAAAGAAEQILGTSQ
jgi:hypothetical protein